MDLTNPYIELDSCELAHACEERVGQLQAREWTTAAERDALREKTALLLDAVAQQLSACRRKAETPTPVVFRVSDFLSDDAQAKLLEDAGRWQWWGRPFDPDRQA